MEPQQSSVRQYTSASAVKTLLGIGILAGTLDFTTAMIVYQVPPLPLARFIASGAFGSEALSGGLLMAFFGFLFHFTIAFSWTILFFFLFPKIKVLSKNKYITGLLYGIVVWVVMNLLVLPLTKVPPRPFALRPAAIGALILMFMIGLPISILTHRYYSGKKTVA